MSNIKARTPRLGRGLSALMSQPVAVHVPTAEASAVAPSTPTATPAANLTDAVSSDPSPAADVNTSGGGGGGGGEGGGEGGLRQVSVGAIQPNPHQPRQRFSEASLQSLAQSIRSQGLMQPIIVRPVGGTDRYELVAGERRWRSAKLAGLDTVPALVRDLDEQQLAEWALVENLQREDLNPIERAEAFKHLIDRFGLSHDDVATRVGIDRPTVSNLLRLLHLEENTRSLVRDGILSMGQARAIAGLSDPLAQKALAERAVAQSWSVRQVEQEVRKISELNGQYLPSDGSNGSKATRAVSGGGGGGGGHLADLEEQLARQLGGKVRIRPGRRKGSGTLTLAFRDLDHFDSLLQRLGVETE